MGLSIRCDHDQVSSRKESLGNLAQKLTLEGGLEVIDGKHCIHWFTI